MDRYSISFVLVVLILGWFAGSVVGSFLDQMLQARLFDISLTGSWLRIENFYLIQILELRLTPAGLLGLVLAGVFLYKKGGD
jgi:predicted membrane chloride channel (bestrophin family)